MPAPSQAERFRRALDRLRADLFRIVDAEQFASELNGKYALLRLPPDATAAFDVNGNLVRDVALEWKSHSAVASRIQTAFAREQLVVALPPASDS
ncbi:hypothetical protein, partial [Micromonospora ureilytica]|uniref:hypothetical protein n=1 Tax=Micromonospora ureilytica TaxID=709868 RepID=UPI0011CFAC30